MLLSYPSSAFCSSAMAVSWIPVGNVTGNVDEFFDLEMVRSHVNWRIRRSAASDGVLVMPSPKTSEK